MTTSAHGLEQAAVDRFRQLRALGGRLDPAELHEVWAALPAAQVADLLGEWRGGEFDTGHPLRGTLDRAGRRAIRFAAPDDPAPGAGGTGPRMIESRDQVTASTVHGEPAVIDHVKAVDADTVMGVGDATADRTAGRWFWLVRDAAPALG